jgi:hypothetical protein
MTGEEECEILYNFIKVRDCPKCAGRLRVIFKRRKEGYVNGQTKKHVEDLWTRLYTIICKDCGAMAVHSSYKYDDPAASEITIRISSQAAYERLKESKDNFYDEVGKKLKAEYVQRT